MLGSLCDSIESVIWMQQEVWQTLNFFLEARNSAICGVKDNFSISGWTLPFVFGVEPPKILGGPSHWCGPFQPCTCRAINSPLIFLGEAPHVPKNKMEILQSEILSVLFWKGNWQCWQCVLSLGGRDLFSFILFCFCLWILPALVCS